MSEDKYQPNDNSKDDNKLLSDTENDEAITEATDDNLQKEPQASASDNASAVPEPAAAKKFSLNKYNIIRILCLAGFVVFSALFINEVIIQPYRIKKSIEYTRELYNKPTASPTVTAAPSPTAAVSIAPSSAPTPTPDPNRDAQGRLLQFKDLLAVNGDVKGWLTIPDTNVDYVVVQSATDPEYYLDKDIKLEYSKAGTLFIDSHNSLEDNSQNIVIHGHNMVSTAEKMFHYLLKYKGTSYYKEHPSITFDSIYNTGEWKVFAVFVTNGSSKNEKLFDYTRGSFRDASDFLNFVYQIKIRSVLNIDSVDITDDDQLLMLSTCSYEVDDYRTVVVARKVREGEDPSVDVDSVKTNKHPVYPDSYYSRYGGKAPELPSTFEEALANGDISWYTPPADNTAE